MKSIKALLLLYLLPLLISSSISAQQTANADPKPVKCGFILPSDAGTQLLYGLNKIASGDLIFIAESGRFEIRYDTTGSNAVPPDDENSNGIPDYVEQASQFTEQSIDLHFQQFGFPDPTADKPLLITIRDMAFYGDFNSPAREICDGSRYSGCIRVENDFAGFAPNDDPESNRTGALKVTLAHEIKHSIQFATAEEIFSNSPYWNNWLEMDATLSEELIFDEVNDYYNYIRRRSSPDIPLSGTVFKNPDRSPPGAYSYVTWMLPYAEYYGDSFWSGVWEYLSENSDLTMEEAIQLELNEYPDSFGSALLRNHAYHYFTGSRINNSGFGFDEKENYPLAEIQASYNGVPSGAAGLPDLAPVSAHYIQLIPGPDDKGIAEIAFQSPTETGGLGVFYSLKDGGFRFVHNAEYDKVQYLIAEEDLRWEELESIGIIVINPSADKLLAEPELVFGKQGQKIFIRDPDYKKRPKRIALRQNYPNPFNPETTIEFDLNQSARVVLEVFDITGRKVRTLVDGNRLFGEYRVQFNAGNLASGVYLYRLQAGNTVVSRKLTIIK